MGWGEFLLRLAGPALLIGFLLFAAAGGIRPKRKAEPVPDDLPGEPYRIYTREYDVEATAAEALAGLRTASLDFSKGWIHLDDEIWERWVARTDDLLAEQEPAFADGEAEPQGRLRTAIGRSSTDDVLVAVLIDQSGSMKGEPISWAAVSASLLSATLSKFGVRHEVLGFSTAGWWGGRAREKWLGANRPFRPGRLCALRHVVYKSADEPLLTEAARRAIVHPDLLRENVDGEALLWAYARLSAHPEPRKVLIVISDGAPVDDATLQENGPSYLYRHLMTVLEQLAGDPQLVLAGLGINHRVDEYYTLAETVMSPDKLPAASLRILASALERERPVAPS